MCEESAWLHMRIACWCRGCSWYRNQWKCTEERESIDDDVSWSGCCTLVVRAPALCWSDRAVDGYTTILECRYWFESKIIQNRRCWPVDALLLLPRMFRYCWSVCVSISNSTLVFFDSACQGSSRLPDIGLGAGDTRTSRKRREPCFSVSMVNCTCSLMLFRCS